MKTISEAAKSHEFNRDLNGIGSLINKSTIASFKAGAEFAQRWIPVEEELPSNVSSILVRNSDFSPIRSTALYQDRKFYPDFLLTHDQVTHWRPIELK